MNILLLAKGDWGGTGFFLQRAINDLYDEHNARSISYTHAGDYCKYPYDLRDIPIRDIKKWAEWSDVVCIYDGADDIYPIDCPDRPIIEVYNGSMYRSDPAKRNLFANKRNRLQVCLTQDLSRFGPRFIGRVIEESENDNLGYKFTVIHTPTNRALKGTDRIIKEMSGVNGINDYIYFRLIEKASNEECLAAKKTCHVLIDQVKPGGGLGFGINALEAWSMGLPVICEPEQDVEDKIRELVGYIPYVSPTLDGDGTIGSVVERLYNDVEFYKGKAAIGERYIREFHSPEHVSSSFIEVCKEAIDNYKPVSRSKRISVCMIIKDERLKVGNAIASVRGLADEVVVVDTGSTDGGDTFCEELGCKVIRGGDRMHKAQERNKSMSLSSGEFVVVLDADEEIIDPLMLRKEIESLDDRYSNLTIRAGVVMRSGGIPAEEFYQNRCWRPGDFQYKFRAHEIPNYFGSKPFFEAKSSVLFAHYPDKSSAKMKAKLQYTLDRLLLDVKENPDSARPLFYLGRQYSYLGNYDAAILNMKKFLEMTETSGHWDRPNAYWEIYACYKHLSENAEDPKIKAMHMKDAIRNLYMCCVEQPMNRKWWFELGNIYHKAGKPEIAAALLKAVLLIKSEREQGYKSLGLDGYDTHDVIARCLWATGDYDEGLMYADAALAIYGNGAERERLERNRQYFVDKIAALDKPVDM